MKCENARLRSQGTVYTFKNHKVEWLSSAERPCLTDYFHHCDHNYYQLLVSVGRSAANGR